MNILWVEDSFDDISEIASALHRIGHVLIIVSSRTLAIEVLDKGWRGEMILLDSMMPEADRHYTHSGCDLFRDLRSGRWGEWGRTVRVTFITAYGPNVTEYTADLSPSPIILPKPIESTEAITIMERAQPGIYIFNMGSASKAAISVTGEATFNDIVNNHPPLNIEQISQLIAFCKQLFIESDESKLKAAEFILAIANAKNDYNAQQTALQSFRQWLSTMGDQVKEGLKTSAAIVSITSPILKILGLL